MNTIYVPWVYTYQGLTWSGTDILWQVPLDTNSLTCDDIQIALNLYKSPDAFPVDCDFITLSGTGVVFFMDPNSQQLVQSIEINTGAVPQQGFTKADIDFFYIVESSFLLIILIALTLIRQFRKFSPKTFNSIWQ